SDARSSRCVHRMRIASADAIARARDALRLQLLGASADPHDSRSADRSAVHAELGERRPRPACHDRAYARCRVQLAPPVTAPSRGGVAQDPRDSRLPQRRGAGRSLEARRSRDARVGRDTRGHHARAQRRSRSEGAVPGLVLPGPPGHAQPAAPLGGGAAAHAARTVSGRSRLSRIRGLGARLRLVRVPLRPLLFEAIGAVDRLVAARLERNARFLAAVAANRAEHLALTTAVSATAAAATTTTAGATRRAVSRATARRVLQSTRGVELLLAGRPDELLPAVAAGQGLVLKTHVISPPLRKSVSVRTVCNLPDGRASRLTRPRARRYGQRTMAQRISMAMPMAPMAGPATRLGG